MFLLNERPLSPDSAFATPDGTQYPANWLRLSSPEDRAAIGITEVPDPPVYDQRFYWGYDQEGELIPKDHGQLVEQWVQQTKTTAFTLMQPTDWYFIREQDNGTPVPIEIKDERQLVRDASKEKVSAIEATVDTDELAAYITGPDYPSWPPYPVIEEEGEEATVDESPAE